MLRLIDTMVVEEYRDICIGVDRTKPVTDYDVWKELVRWWIQQAEQETWVLASFRKHREPTRDPAVDLVYPDLLFSTRRFDDFRQFVRQLVGTTDPTDLCWVGIANGYPLHDIVFTKVMTRLSRFIFWQKREQYLQLMPNQWYEYYKPNMVSMNDY